MSIEINRARVAADGTVTCEMVFPNIGSFSRGANEVLRIEAAAFANHEAAERAQANLTGTAIRERQNARIPRASMPPYVTPECETLGGQPLPESVEALMERQIEEPDGLKAGEAYAYGEALQDIKAGGTD